MRHILHLLSSLEFGGKERAALRLARRAVAEGHQSSLLLFDKPYRADGRDFDPGPVPCVFLPRRPGLDLRFAKALAELYTDREIDVVHAHNDSAHVYAWLAKRLASRHATRVVSTLHSRPHHGGAMARLIMRTIGGPSPQAYAVAQELADHVMATGWLRSCGVIVNGIDAAEFPPTGTVRNLRGELSIPSDHILFGHVARPDPIKRHDDLFAAMRRLEADKLPVTVICVGHGELLPALRRRAAKLENVRFIESLVDVPMLLRSIDGVVLCSDHEGTPLALLEAMSCAKPIVATAVGGVPALLGANTESNAGILVPPRHPEMLAAALAAVACDRSFQQQLAEKSHRRSAAFSFEKEWASYAAIYDNASD